MLVSVRTQEYDPFKHSRACLKADYDDDSFLLLFDKLVN